MVPVEWNESFSVGNALMDAHHQVFFQMVRQFGESADKVDRNAMKEQLDFLIEYTVMHLGAEEDLMRQAGYRDFASHKAVHDDFARKVRYAAEAFGNTASAITPDKVLKMIQDWLVGHILHEDKRYQPCVQTLMV